MQDPKDRTASVADTSRGIGPDIARALAKAGANAPAAPDASEGTQREKADLLPALLEGNQTIANNRALVQRAFEAHPILGSPEAATLREFYADDFVFSGASSYVRSLDAFSDIQVELREIKAESDRVVVRWDATGVQSGEFQGVPPSGDRVAVTGITVLRCRDGRIAEAWANLSWV